MTPNSLVATHAWVSLETIGFMLRKGLMVKRNPNSVFQPIPSLN